MRSLSIAWCMTVGLALSGASEAVAQNRSAPKNATIVTSNVSSANMSTTSNANASSRQDTGQFERKCVIMSCGTPWCFNTRR